MSSALEQVRNWPSHLPRPEMSNGFAICKIVAAVERVFCVRFTGEFSVSRSRTRSEARAVAMYMSRQLLDLSVKEIGEAFEKDYTSVYNAIEKVDSSEVLQREAVRATEIYKSDSTLEHPPVFATYVVQFDKQSPAVGAGTEVLGGKLSAVQFDDGLLQLDQLREAAGVLIDRLDAVLDEESLDASVIEALAKLRDLV